MATLAQGTSLFWIDDTGNGPEVKHVAATNISGISAQRDSLESTDLEQQAKTYMPGLMSPGSAQLSIQFDPSNSAHQDLHAAYKAGRTLKWALGWSDGATVPTEDGNGAFTLPTDRSFLTFDGFIQDVTFDFSLNSIVTSQVSVQVSGMPTLHAKGGASAFMLYTIAPADTAADAAFLDAMTPFGSAGNDTGILMVTTSAGNYGWIAIPAGVIAHGVSFTDLSNGFVGGWDGATSAGNWVDAPIGSHQVVTDSNGIEYWLFRQDYANVNPTPNQWRVATY